MVMSYGRTANRRSLQRLNKNFARFPFAAFALKGDGARRGIAAFHFIHQFAVDVILYSVAFANDFVRVPFAAGVFILRLFHFRRLGAVALVSRAFRAAH